MDLVGEQWPRFCFGVFNKASERANVYLSYHSVRIFGNLVYNACLLSLVDFM